MPNFNSPAERLVALLDELKYAVMRVLEDAQSGATKHDLHEMERRLLEAIQANNPTRADLKALDGLLVRSRGIAARLSSLDAQTNPK